MALRRDAYAGAARIALELRDYARSQCDVTVTVGTVSVSPGGVNVVPGAAEFTVDARAPTPEGVAALERQVADVTTRVAREESLEAELEETFSLEPLALDPALVDAVERAAGAEGASSLRLPSGAGHDAMVIGRRVPAAMIFVPSTGGISHSPAERTPADELELGVRVLAGTLEQVLTQEPP